MTSLSDSGSEDLDSFKSTSHSRGRKNKKPGRGSTFGVQRDPTPESPSLSPDSDPEPESGPNNRKQSTSDSGKKRKRPPVSLSPSPSDPEDDILPTKASKKAGSDQKSKFFKRKTQVRPKSKVTGAFGTGHSSADDDEEAADSDEMDKPSPKKKTSTTKTKTAPSVKDFQVKLGEPQSVSKGKISKTTMQFLQALQLETCNDRQWFAAHDAQYRHAWKQWQDFVEVASSHLQLADPEIPELPAKDLVHRIYRDVRFSSDKRPYKTVLSMSTSRGGRKGKFAGYYLQIKGNNQSLLAGGIWCPDKDEMATIRHNLLNNPDLFRQVIGAPSFVQMFGAAEPLPRPQKPKKSQKKKAKNGDEDDDIKDKEQEPIPQPEPSRRRNVFGHEDELVNAPKGVPKDHEHIDLLRLRTIAVSKTFTDQEVLADDFHEKIRTAAAEMTPLVHLLNDMLVPNGVPPPRSSS